MLTLTLAIAAATALYVALDLYLEAAGLERLCREVRAELAADRVK